MKSFLKLFLVFFFLFPFFSQMAVAHEYPAQVGEKLGTGVANVVTGFMEIPKTMIATGRQKGATHGMTAGFFTGIVHMLGRTLSGAVDIATFFAPTTPFVKPTYIWDDFDRETTYAAWRMR